MLEACHQRVHRMLDLTQRLAAHLRETGADTNTQQAARDVMRYFDLAAPAHHEDEERHVLPRLRQDGQVALAERLHDDHTQMSRPGPPCASTCSGWQTAAGRRPTSTQRLRAGRPWRALYRAHIEAEEMRPIPSSQTAIDAATRRVMGDEMARRRGLPGTV